MKNSNIYYLQQLDNRELIRWLQVESNLTDLEKLLLERLHASEYECGYYEDEYEE